MKYSGIHRCAYVIAAVISHSVLVMAEEPSPIKDNSFLIEEAYNQEPGVIQWIATVQHFRDPTNFWAVGLTQEFPLDGIRHQLSWTVPLETNEYDEFGLGRVALHYRYQLEDSSAGTACAPRLSLLLPTDKTSSIGTELIELQANLPVSIVMTGQIVLHLNAGATYSPGNSVDSWYLGMSDDDEVFVTYFAGTSVVWLAHPNANLLLEILHSSFEDFVSTSLEHFEVERFEETIVNPGVRVAINAPFGQFVPGVGVPIRVTEGETDIGIFGYLSFEHSL